MSKSTCCPPDSRDQPTAVCCPPTEQAEPAATDGAAEPGNSSENCCLPNKDGCCPDPAVRDDRPGYKLWPFVTAWLDTPVGRAPAVATTLGRSEILQHWQMRWGIGRLRFSIAPGLYALGRPGAASPVLVTANYKMTFDLLRRELGNRDLWLLVLDTKGINVWCAAGKGTFGTDELVARVQASGLERLVTHRHLILPQLGAVGVAAHQVRQRCGFQVRYGPVRAADLPAYLDAGEQAAPAMRRVTFTLRERLVLTPVELVGAWKQVICGILVLLLLGGIGPEIFTLGGVWARGGAAVAAGLAGLVTGAILTPLLLPWLPGRAFAFKGAVAGLIVALVATVVWVGPLNWLNSLALLIALPTVSSWFAMHFTGSTPYTSPSGVEKEMRKAIPSQAAALVVAGVCWFGALL